MLVNYNYLFYNIKTWKKRLFSYLKKISEDYQFALVSSATRDTTKEILEILGLKDFFDFVYATEYLEKDSKEVILDDLIKNHDSVEVFIGKSERDKKLCGKRNIRVVSDLDGLKSFLNDKA